MRIRILGTLLVWLGAVVSVAAIAWFAIDAAGRQVIDDPAAESLAGAPIAATAPGAVVTATSSPTATPRAGASNSGSNSVGPRRSATPTAGSSEVAITQEHTVVAVASTYATEAGRVRVRCDGARITLAGGFAQPATGWAVRVRSGGPDQVRVRFARFDPAGWRTLLVVAVCVDQHPSFEQTWVDARPDGDRGDGEGRSAESGAGQHPNW